MWTPLETYVRRETADEETSIMSSRAEHIFNRALSALRSDDVRKAEKEFRRVIDLDPSHVPALNLLTVALMSLEKFGEAEPFIARAVALNQRSDVSFYNYGIVAKRLKKPKLAHTQFTNALELNPNVAETWNNRGTTSNDLGSYESAISDFNRAIGLNRHYAECYANKGKSLNILKRHDEALVAYQTALDIKPRLAEAWVGRGNAFLELRRYEEALFAYDKAASTEPDLEGAQEGCIRAKMYLCKWDRLEENIGSLTSSIRAGTAIFDPFTLLALADSPDDHLLCARTWVAAMHPPASESIWPGTKYRHDKIRLGYASADLYRHATAHLVAEVFELHDKDRFELTAFSFGPDDGSDVRRRLMRPFDKNVD
jgi:protein O-GlcNAc transferase